MKLIIKLITIKIIIVCFTAISFAATVTTTAPQITITQIGATPVTILLNTTDTDFGSVYDIADTATEGALSKYKNQTELANGFANASAYASRAATQQGYQDYDLFAVTTGAMIGLQTPGISPGSVFTIGDRVGNLEDDIEEDGDIYAGIGTGAAFLNVGVNSRIIYPGLYLNVVYGSLNVDQFEDENFTAKSTLFGIGANYTWIQSKSLPLKIIKWRGVSFGTGFYYNKTDVEMTIEMEPQSATDTYFYAGYGNIPWTVSIIPSYIMGLEVTTYTIPLDVTTSAMLLWFLNLNLGLGVDISWGSSDITLKSNGEVTGEINDPNVEYTVTPGSVTIDGSTKGGKPTVINPRLTTGIGINILPVKIDVPMAYYFVENGYSIGVTAGFVW